MTDKPQTAWMWLGDIHTSGLTIDVSRERLHWVDKIGCGCTDSRFEQSFDQFLENGPPLYDVPPNILDEIRSAVEMIRKDA